MSDTDLELYKANRPYLRAFLAWSFFLRWSTPFSGDVIITVEQCFVLADDFLTSFEMRRSA